MTPITEEVAMHLQSVKSVQSVVKIPFCQGDDGKEKSRATLGAARLEEWVF